MIRTLILAVLAAAVLRLVISDVAPVLDRTDDPYAQIAHEMVVTGDWVTPHLYVGGDLVPFLGKPPLFFWTAALAIKAFGTTELAVRLPSLAALAALLVLMYFALVRALGRSTTALAILMTATSAIIFFLAGTAIVDVHLTFLSGWRSVGLPRLHPGA